ncbi:MAG: hypothetical protein ACLGHR_13795 [Gammaproteobacteria bacterium]
MADSSFENTRTSPTPGKARAIVAELKKYDKALAAKPRWIVLTKLDMVPEDEREQRVKDFKRRLRWKGPLFAISALARDGLEPLVHAVYDHVAAQRSHDTEQRDPRFDAPPAEARDG